MKKTTYLFALFIAIPLLSGCFNNAPKDPEIVSLTFVDGEKEYAKGDIYNDCKALTISATYDNEQVEDVSVNDVSISVIREYEIEGVSEVQDINEPFVYTGTYSLSITYKSFTSEKVLFKVIDAHTYVTSLTLDGVSTGLEGDVITLEASTLPVDSSAGISFITSDDDKASVTSLGKKVTVSLLEAGEVTITAISKLKNGEDISSSHVINIDELKNEITDIKQNYQQFGYNEKYYQYHYSSTPTIGEANMLVIPVWLKDSGNIIDEAYKDNIRDDIRKAYLGTSEETGWHSVKSYYEEESAGILTLNGTVADWYESNYSIAQAGTNSNYTNSILNSAVNNYFNTHTNESRKDYDKDGDGYLDGVVIVYAAPDNTQPGYGAHGNLWAYTSWTFNNANVDNPTVNCFFWVSYDFLYGANNCEERTGTPYYRGDCTVTTVDSHCLIHEMGHSLGLDDYYDYGGSFTPAGGFSMQDYNVGGHDAFSVMAYGWADAYIPKETTTIKLGSFQEHKEVILLTPSWNDYDSPFDEYILLELFTPTGLNELDTSIQYMGSYPSATKNVGIRLWHVDARLVKSNGSPLRPTFYNDVNTSGGVTTAFNNTSSGSRASSYGADKNLLQLIRKDTSVGLKTYKQLSSDDLFYAGDTFTMEEYQGQFVNGFRLNSNLELGWSFTVNSIHEGEETYAFIKVEKMLY